jgi:hypothetical protein
MMDEREEFSPIGVAKAFADLLPWKSITVDEIAEIAKYLQIFADARKEGDE